MEPWNATDLGHDRPTLVVHDVAASWTYYPELALALDPAPPGLLLQLAGATDEGIRVVAVWATLDNCRRFQTEQFEPALLRSLHRMPAQTRRELCVGHILDPRRATTTTPSKSKRLPGSPGPQKENTDHED